MTQYYDVTRPLSGSIAVYPGDIEPRFSTMDCGQYLLTDIRMSTHSGTHIDAPSHYLKNGESVDKIPFDALLGSCRVIETPGKDGEITPGDIRDTLKGTERVLLKTGYRDSSVFDPSYPALNLAAATLLTSSGITVVGTDTPSIEKFQGSGDVHRALLGRGVVVIEFLDLSCVPEGDYTMVALPLRLPGLDGSPARVILVKN